MCALEMLVVATGKHARFGAIAGALSKAPPPTTFEWRAYHILSEGSDLGSSSPSWIAPEDAIMADCPFTLVGV